MRIFIITDNALMTDEYPELTLRITLYLSNNKNLTVYRLCN